MRAVFFVEFLEVLSVSSEYLFNFCYLLALRAPHDALIELLCAEYKFAALMQDQIAPVLCLYREAAAKIL
jgi:hypothetical protein